MLTPKEKPGREPGMTLVLCGDCGKLLATRTEREKGYVFMIGSTGQAAFGWELGSGGVLRSTPTAHKVFGRRRDKLQRLLWDRGHVEPEINAPLISTVDRPLTAEDFIAGGVVTPTECPWCESINGLRNLGYVSVGVQLLSRRRT